MSTAVELVSQVDWVLPITMLIAAFGLSRATFYRHQTIARQGAGVRSPRPTPARALDAAERRHVLDILNSERFVDSAPAEVFSTLLDEKKYFCSERTMYRILAANEQVRERRNQARHPNYAKPELVATGPNQVWTWDITKLKTFEKFVYLNLYVMLDVFSRYVVGWMVAEHDNATLAERFLKETISKYHVDHAKLQIHSDRGSAMRSLAVTQMLARLGVTQSFSRPRVSNDNPFSESQFKTVKYHSTFPQRFGGVDDAIAFSREFFPWYNTEHHHSNLAYLTPEVVHFGRADQMLAVRNATLTAAYERNPERFGRPPSARRPPVAVYINPPKEAQTEGPAAKPESGNSDPPNGSPPTQAPTEMQPTHQRDRTVKNSP